MAEPTLTFLGERIERIQAELRDLRGMRADLSHLRADIDDRFEGVNTRIDNLERSIEARFDQAHQTMATNLALVLEAIKGSKPRAE